MRRSIFDLMNDNEIDVKREYIRIHKLFEEDTFYSRYSYISIYEYIDRYFFENWDKRGRCLLINDMFTSFNIRNKQGLYDDTIEKLLLYIEVIINLIRISDIEILIDKYIKDKNEIDELKKNIK